LTESARFHPTFFYAGLSPSSVGLYRVKATIPPGVPEGNLDATIRLAGSIGNVAQIAVQ
jgi:uncharacterized protein (TIGR03437 family)